MSKKINLFLAVSLFLASCGQAGAQPTPTIDVNDIYTAVALTAVHEITLAAPSVTPSPAVNPTETPVPTVPPSPTVAVTLQPVVGLATDNLTVRSEPRKGSDNLGGIFFNQKINILARNPQATWYYIQWADSASGFAWTVSRGVELQNFEIGRLPIADYDASNQLVLYPPVLWEVVGTPLPIPPVPSGDKVRPATVISPANLRVCPTLGCLVLGLLQPGQAVNMTGRYGDNEWAQIDYPSGPGGKAWISREALQPGPDNLSGLPYFNALGIEITPEPPTPTPDPNASPTATFTPEPVAAGPQAKLEADTVVYAEPNSLSAQLVTLKAGEQVYITGLSVIGSWYQIQYPPFSDGRAYISQAKVKVLGDMRKVPYFDAQGNLIPTP